MRRIKFGFSKREIKLNWNCLLNSNFLSTTWSNKIKLKRLDEGSLRTLDFTFIDRRGTFRVLELSNILRLSNKIKLSMKHLNCVPSTNAHIYITFLCSWRASSLSTLTCPLICRSNFILLLLGTRKKNSHTKIAACLLHTMPMPINLVYLSSQFFPYFLFCESLASE